MKKKTVSVCRNFKQRKNIGWIHFRIKPILSTLNIKLQNECQWIWMKRFCKSSDLQWIEQQNRFRFVCSLNDYVCFRIISRAGRRVRERKNKERKPCNEQLTMNVHNFHCKLFQLNALQYNTNKYIVLNTLLPTNDFNWIK